MEAYEFSRVINRWPAIILAANRIAKVRGRMIELIISIIVINGINRVGVLVGIKCAKNEEVFMRLPYILIDSQTGKANLIVKVIWLEAVKL